MEEAVLAHAPMTTDAELADRLEGMLRQVGHPDYSLTEFFAGIKQIIAALRRQSGDYVMVPREPTEAMVRAGNSARGVSAIRGVNDPRSIYRAMLTAAEASKGDRS